MAKGDRPHEICTAKLHYMTPDNLYFSNVRGKSIRRCHECRKEWLRADSRQRRQKRALAAREAAS